MCCDHFELIMNFFISTTTQLTIQLMKIMIASMKCNHWSTHNMRNVEPTKKKGASWFPVTNHQPNNVVFAMLVYFKQTKRNQWKPFTFVICALQSHDCTQITVLECIKQCLTVLENDFPFYSCNGFRQTSMPKHSGMLKTIIWVQGKIIYVIFFPPFLITWPPLFYENLLEKKKSNFIIITQQVLRSRSVNMV